MAANRRQFLASMAAAPFFRSPSVRVPGPEVSLGIASGDVSPTGAVIWARADRPGRMVVEFSTTEAFRDASTVVGPLATPETDLTARVALEKLPPGQTIFYRVRFRDADSAKVAGEPVTGRFATPSDAPRDIRFAWGGDVAGQGWGIDPSRGGMAIFDAIRKADPHFFVHSGDHIYADNPIAEEVRLDDGSLWRNLVTPEVAKVAETLEEFRGRYRYNLLDAPFRRFLAEVPMLAQWDDHETLNNWYPGEILDDPRYAEKDVNTLAKRARRAFLDYLPMIRRDEPIYRVCPQGPLLDVFLLDERTYRGANSANRQTEPGPASAFLGRAQLDWLKSALKGSRARWKVIASDMPIGLVVRDGASAFEAVANGDPGPPSGRELEIAELLAFVKAADIRNVVWITADVHYAAAHHYDPSRARTPDFRPFWEFVAGPLHAGTFGPGELDPTFGPELKFSAIPPGTKPNRPPSDGLQFFGNVAIAGKTAVMSVSLHDRSGKTLYSVELPPE